MCWCERIAERQQKQRAPVDVMCLILARHTGVLSPLEVPSEALVKEGNAHPI